MLLLFRNTSTFYIVFLFVPNGLMSHFPVSYSCSSHIFSHCRTDAKRCPHWWKIGKFNQYNSTSQVVFAHMFPTEVFTKLLSGFCSAHATSMTFSFLCELKRFLGDVLPHDNPESPPLQLDSLPSMPPLSLDIFSSDTLLAALINSSSPTIFRFPRWGSVSQWHPGQLAMSPTLVEEVGQRLEQIELELMDVFRLREDGHRTKKRLERLQALGAFPITQPAAAETQYRAFLLLKALQTVARVYSAQRGPRATRADPSNPVRSSICGLRSLTVSLERRLMGPNTANINNCQGSCAFPLTNANNHSVLLHFYIESGNVNERAPCCVPVAYEPLEVVDLNEHGTYLTIKPDVVATECGCR
uniref:Anti-Mullerian hormone n=1 Tax=Echeneis naucrates TaxID=173247 RepID=A0A665WH41_ECHNA